MLNLPTEMPSITTSAYSTSTGNTFNLGDNWADTTSAASPLSARRMVKLGESFPHSGTVIHDAFQTGDTPVSTRRLVQVFIADPNDNVPLADALLYKGEPQFTDATDQELYFELDIKGLLAAHNEKRTKVLDKKVKDRQEYLEPAKVRDLRMVVVEIAKF